MKKLLAGLLLATATLSGCATFSNAPGVTAVNDNGEYLTVVNKRTIFMGYPISSRNVVVRCNAKDDKCDTLNLWGKDGWRIY